MHPESGFAWNDPAAMLAFVGDTAFATIFISARDGTRLVHAPVQVLASDRLRFHISARNAAAQTANGARAFISCLGPHSYVSPDWYGTANQVPTWNYVAVECEGRLARLDEIELIALLDALSHLQETKLAPKTPWTRDKMDRRRFEAMVQAIHGYELHVEALRGTRKLGQNKSLAEIESSAAVLRALGEEEMALRMETARA